MGWFHKHGSVGFAYSPEILSSLRNVERDGGELKPIELDTDYLRTGGKFCEKKVVQAGYRLVAVLKQIAD
jgi:hypothetical protein